MAKAKPRGRSRSRKPTGSPKHQRDPYFLPKGSRWVVGIHAAREVLKIRPEQVSQFYLRDDWEQKPEGREFAEAAKKWQKPLQIVPSGWLDRLCPSHQGVAIIVRGGPELHVDDLDGPDRMVVMILDQVTDPHNLGAILRTAWLMGVKALFVPEMRSSHLSPSATKVASGGAEHVPVIIESHLPNLIKDLKEKDFWVYGLAAEGAKALWSLKFPSKVAWVVGAEDKGLRSTVASSCDELVAIFQTASSASYNASVAAGMALAETLRQQKNP